MFVHPVVVQKLKLTYTQTERIALRSVAENEVNPPSGATDLSGTWMTQFRVSRVLAG